MNHRVKLYPENIPSDLTAIDQWVCYRRMPKEKDPTKTDKKPIDPKSGKYAGVDNHETWGMFEQAVAKYNEDSSISGVGIVLTPDLGIVGIDFDDCLSADGTFLWGADDVENINSYTEKSPSDAGIRIFAKGTLPPSGRKKGKIELYNSGRFLTVTGNVIGKCRLIEDRSEKVSEFHKRIFPKKENDRADVTDSDGPTPANLIDDQIIQKAKKAKNGTLFHRLFNGDHSDYPSASEGDQALCNILAFWTGRDAQAIDRLFRQSGLMREKWDKPHYASGETYGQVTIQKAIANTHDVYNSPKNMTGNEIQDADDLDAAINDLNNKHAILMLGGKCVVLNEIHDPAFDCADINFSSPDDFCTRYRNQKVSVFKNGKRVNIGIGSVWLDTLQRRQFDGIVFDPGRKVVPNYYNLFRGFAINSKQGSWSRMKEHIHEIICGGHDESFKYVLAWMARLVQDPGGKRPGVVIVLRGRQGTGKGCFVSNYGAIFGNHFLHIISCNLVAGRFSSHFKDALLVFVDEGFWGGNKQAEGALKGMITEDKILIEGKYKDAFNIKNHTNFIFASNNDWVVPAGLEERRFFVMDVSDKRMRDSAYFKSLFNEIENGGREAMLHDLLQLDITEINLRQFPRNEALFDQIIQTMPSVRKFWFELLRDGQICSTEEKLVGFSTTAWPETFTSSILHEFYCAFSSRIGDRYKMIDTQFGKSIREMCPKIERKRLSGKWTYFLPSLDECRESFEKLVNMKLDWGLEENHDE